MPNFEEYLLTFRPSALIHCDSEDMVRSFYVQNITKIKTAKVKF